MARGLRIPPTPRARQLDSPAALCSRTAAPLGSARRHHRSRWMPRCRCIPMPRVGCCAHRPPSGCSGDAPTVVVPPGGSRAGLLTSRVRQLDSPAVRPACAAAPPGAAAPAPPSFGWGHWCRSIPTPRVVHPNRLSSGCSG
eukprot:4554959-Alexandrium_andersonii.AAC.1